ILFTCDLLPTFEDYPAEIMENEYDLTMTELTHHRIFRALDKLMFTKTKFMIFSHVYDLYHGAGKKDAERLLNMLPYKYEIAYDGYEFVL
ncbi:MAG: hypothetical protein GX633_02295, partial [Clostridiales bacterium]|nr:hypothetical protein [Clostridiales bacterium]